MRARSCCSGMLWSIIFIILISGCQKKIQNMQQDNPTQAIINQKLGLLAAVNINANSRQLSLKQKQGIWSMEQPVTAPVEKNQLNELWQRLTGLQGKLILGSEDREEVEKIFTKQQPELVIELINQHGKAERLLGILDQEHKKIRYLKHEKNKNIFALQTEYWIDINRWAKRLEARNLLFFNYNNIVEIDYRYDNRIFNLKRNSLEESHLWQLISPINKPANTEAVILLLKYLGEAQFFQVKETSIWGKTILSRYGLQKPIARLSIRLEDQRLPKVLIFGQLEDEGGMLYAKFHDETRIVSVPLLLLTKILVQFEQIEIEKKLFTFMHMVSRIDCRLPDYQRRLVLQNNEWMAHKLIDNVETDFEDSTIAREEAVVVIEFLNQLTYETAIETGTSAYDDFKSAQPFGVLIFYAGLGEPLVQIGFYQHREIKEYLFIKKDIDGKVLVIEKNKLKPIFIKK